MPPPDFMIRSAYSVICHMRAITASYPGNIQFLSPAYDSLTAHILQCDGALAAHCLYAKRLVVVWRNVQLSRLPPASRPALLWTEKCLTTLIMDSTEGGQLLRDLTEEDCKSLGVLDKYMSEIDAILEGLDSHVMQSLVTPVTNFTILNRRGG